VFAAAAATRTAIGPNCSNRAGHSSWCDGGWDCLRCRKCRCGENEDRDDFLLKKKQEIKKNCY
jgi:hypothetical protein